MSPATASPRKRSRRSSTPGRRGTILVFGATAAGRHLVVVTTLDEGEGTVFIVTARQMTPTEKRRYRAKAR